MMFLRINNILIPVPADFSARLDKISSLFSEEVIVGQYSFPFELAITPEFKAATHQIEWSKKQLIDVAAQTEFDCDVVEGIQRFTGKLKITGRSAKKVRCEITLGISVIYDWMKNTRLRDLDLGTVTLNSDVILKFVDFTFYDAMPAADSGNFGIGINWPTAGYDAVPWNTDMATTIADFVTQYNAGSWAPAFMVTASQPSPNVVRFTANFEGGEFVLDTTNSIAYATLPISSYDSEPWSVVEGPAFDWEAYRDDVVYEIDIINSDSKNQQRRCCFPIIKNPNFIKEEIDLLGGMYCGYLNYNPYNLDPIAGNTTDFPWRYHVVPMPFLFNILLEIFDSQGYGYNDDFCNWADPESNGDLNRLFIYNNKSIDQPYYVGLFGGDPTNTVNIYAGSFAINEHVPDITVLELITALKLWRNLSITIDDVTKQVTMMRIAPRFGADYYNELDSFAGEGKSVDWTDFADEATTQEWDMPEQDGITLKFTHDGNDDVYDEMIADISTYDLQPEVDNVGLLPNVAGPNLAIPVRDQNQIYVTVGTEMVFRTEMLDDFVHEGGALVIQTTLSTLPSLLEADQFAIAQGLTGGDVRHWFIPYSKQVGDHQRSGEFEPNQDYSLRVGYYRGKVEDGITKGYYLAGNHTRNPYVTGGGFIFHDGVAFAGDEGVFVKDYEKWYNFLKFGRYCYMEFLLPLVEQLKFSILSWVWLRDKRYLIKKLITPLPFQQRVKVEAIQKDSDVKPLFFLPFTICEDAQALLLVPYMEGGVWSGDGVVPFGDDFYFDPATAGAGVTTVTYVLNGLTWTQSIEVKALPTVTLSAFATKHVGDAPFALSGGSPGGGYYQINGVTVTTFSPAVYGIGVHTVYYIYTDGFTCASFATQTITVIA